MVSIFDYPLLSRGVGVVLGVIGDICNTNDDMVIILNVNNEILRRIIIKWGIIFIKVDKFELGIDIGTITEELPLNVLSNTADIVS